MKIRIPFFLAIFGMAIPAVVHGQTVTSAAELQAALNTSATPATTSGTIVFANSISLTGYSAAGYNAGSGFLGAINAPTSGGVLTVNGGGNSLTGGSNALFFASPENETATGGVSNPTPQNVTIENLTISGATSRGGTSSFGGGGAGLGGGLFVGTGVNVILNSVTFNGNLAAGGASLALPSVSQYAGAGIGGASGQSGGGGYGGGGLYATGSLYSGGGVNGGQGPHVPGQSGGFGGGGAYYGGAGGFGGGSAYSGGPTASGFGGGASYATGAAGFGGGGGGFNGIGGVGGGGVNGGGAGFGGAIFVQNGATLMLTGDDTLSGDTTTVGAGIQHGAAVGNEIFMMTGSSVALAPGSGNTVTIGASGDTGDNIADDSASSLPIGQPYRAGTAAGAGLVLGSSANPNGTVILYGTNTYAGGTSLQNGVKLVVGSSQALGIGALTTSGNTVVYTNGVTVANPIVMTGDTALEVDDLGSATQSGVISESGASHSITKTGTGTLILTNANTYSGGTTINSGILEAQNNSALGTGAVTVSSGTTLTLSNGITVANDITISGTGSTGQGAIYAVTGSPSVVTETVAGTVTLAANASVGADNVESELSLGAVDLQSFTLTTSGTGRVNLEGNITGGGGLTVGSQVYAVGGQNSFTGLTDVLSNADLILDDSSGVVVSGDLTIEDGGAVFDDVGGQLAQTTTVTLNGNGALHLTADGPETIAGLQGTSGTSLVTISSPFPSNNPTALTLAGTGTYAYAGQITDSFSSPLSLVKEGTGTQTLSGANTYSGGTTISAGILEAANNSALGTGDVAVTSGGTLQLTGGITLSNNVTISGTGAIFVNDNSHDNLGGNVTLAGNATINVTTTNNNNFTAYSALNLSGTVNLGANDLTLEGTYGLTNLSGQVTGSGGITVSESGGGSAYLSGSIANTYTGLTTVEGQNTGNYLFLTKSANTTAILGNLDINGGILIDKSTGQFTPTSVVTITNGGFFAFQYGPAPSSETIAGINGTSGTSIDDFLFYSANITVAGSGNYAYAGQLTEWANGALSLTMQGTGTQILSGANSYSGGTTLAGGILQAGSATALGTGTISFTGGTLQYGAGVGQDFSSQFSNAASQLYSIDTNGQNVEFTTALTSIGGSLTKLGDGFLVLIAPNTYTGGTTISAGTLLLGDGSTAGASLGSGDVTVNGTGTFTLDLADGETFSNNIIDNAAVILDDFISSNYTVSGNISGTGTVVKTGANTVTVTGNNNYSGGTTLNDGTLIAGNASAFGTGLLQVNGGTLKMGNGNHTISVHNYAQTAGTLYLTVTGAGQAATVDQLHVTNTLGNPATLGGNLTVNLAGFTRVGNGAATYAFTVVATDAGYNGNFVFDPLGLGQGLSATLDYTTTPEDVLLQIVQAANSFSLAGLTPNQQAIGSNINTTILRGKTSPLIVALSNAIAASPRSLGNYLDQLSPQAFGQFTSTTAANNASFDTEAHDNYIAGQRSGPNGTFVGGNGGIDASGLTVNDPSYDPALAMVHSRLLAWNPAPSGHMLSDMPGPMMAGVEMKDPKAMKSTVTPAYSNPWNFYVRGNVILAQGFSQQDVSHFDDNTASVVLGTDYRITPNFLIGLTAGYGHTDATLDTNGSSATVDSYSPGLYASYADKGWYANLSGHYIHNAYTQSRVINFLGQTANSAPEGNQGVANLDGGYDFHQGALTFGPLVGVQYTHLTVDGYHETGSAADLSVSSQDTDSLRSRLGGRISYALTHGGIIFTPHFDASWQHECLDQNRGITSQFNGGLGSFSVQTVNPSRDSALVDAGLDAEINHTVTVFGDYEVQAGQDNYLGQSVQAGVKIGF